MQVLMKACIGDIVKVNVHVALAVCNKDNCQCSGNGEHFARTETLTSTD